MKDQVYSTHEVARLLGTNPSSVVRWVDDGSLKAFRTPGGHRRVRHEDLRKFFEAFDIPVPDRFGESAGTRIVVVEPDSRAASALARALRKADASLEVVVASDAIDALVRVGVAPPWALVVDAGADVASIARALRGQPATASVVLVAVMSRADGEHEKRLKAAGARAVLTRPVAADLLLALR